jgi:HD-GYP domain-containing protein (c-di-GMP phosphodiesterase class II)
LREAISYYVTAVTVTSLVAVAAVAVVAEAPTFDAVVAALFFGGLVLLSMLLRYEGSKSGASGTISFLPALALIVVSPTVLAPVSIGVAAVLAEIAARRPLRKLAFNAAQLTLATAVPVVAVSWLYKLTGSGLLSDFVALALASTAFHGVNTVAVATAIAIDSKRPLREVWIQGALRTLPYDLLAIPVVYLLVWSYRGQGITSVLLFVIPILGLRQFYKQNWELERTNEELLGVMVKAIEARDPYTSGHSLRVSRYAVAIGRICRLDTKTLESLRVAAMLHDVGKIHEEYATILQKNGPLDPDEAATMRRHPIRSAELVQQVSRLRPLTPAIRAHHERWDGRGYPDQLSGEGIPLVARYIAIADTIDAMTTSRPYRRALTLEEVELEIRAGVGTQFDPSIASRLLQDANWSLFVEAAEESVREAHAEVEARASSVLPV